MSTGIATSCTSCATSAAAWRRAPTGARCWRISGTGMRCTGRTRRRRSTRCGTRSPCRRWCCAPGRRSCRGSGSSCPPRRRSGSRRRCHRRAWRRSTRITTRSRRTTIPSPPSVRSCARADAPGRSRLGAYLTGGPLPAGWIRSRLAAWFGPDEVPLPSRSQRLAEDRRQVLADQAARRALDAAGRAAAADYPAQAARARRALAAASTRAAATIAQADADSRAASRQVPQGRPRNCPLYHPKW